jgi:hypothetical protein
MAQRVYLETTIPSYLTAWPSRDLIIAGHQQITKEWWRSRRSEFELCISQFVLDEAGAGDTEAANERMAILGPLPLLDISKAVLTRFSNPAIGSDPAQSRARCRPHRR